MPQRHRIRLVAALVVTLLLTHAHAGAQQRRGASTGTPSARGTTAAPAPAASSPAAPAAVSPTSPAARSHIEDTTILLRRDQVDARLAAQPAAANPASKSRFGGLTNALKGAVTGDARRETAAKQLLEELAVNASVKGARTVVVVIGSEDDRTKVRESLATTERQIVLALLDTDFKDDLHDNSAIGGGMADKVTGAATNIWVYLPRPSAAARRVPEHTLSTRIVSERVWTGIFTADGDAPNVNAFTSRPAAAPAAAAATSPTAAPVVSADPSAIAVGDVVLPKIGGVKVLAQPSDTAKVAATLTKTDELVVTGVGKDGYVNVQGASASGWIKAALLAKQ